MRIKDLINEGGWSTTATQSTVINPKVVKDTLVSLQQFTNDFNKFLAQKGVQPVRVGRPTGSSAYHDVDPEDKVYGDIDVQMVGNPLPGVTPSQYSAYYNKLADEFIKTYKPKYLHPTDSTIGHPIFNLGNDQYVQVDFMWHSPELEKWGAARVTPERGVKGSLFGNMFSVLGEILDMSIQHAGVQLKVVDGQKVPFSKQKNTELKTITTNPETFILDIFKYLAKQAGLKSVKMPKDLSANTGADLQNPSVSKLILGVKALAHALEVNDLYGKGELQNFANKEDFLNKFLQRYEGKAIEDLEGKKREKATTPQAIERAKSDREKILKGLGMVKSLFAGNVSETKGLPMPGTYEQEFNMFKRKGPRRITAMTNEEQIEEKWSSKYKKSINCNNPKGFSQKAHCAGRKARQAGKHTKSKSINK